MKLAIIKSELTSFHENPEVIFEHVRNFNVNGAEISIFLNEDHHYIEEDILRLINRLPKVGANWHYRDPIFGTDILIGVGEENMKSLVFQVQ